MNRDAENAYWRVERYHSEMCGICREPYENQDRIYLLCNHSFHEECFTQHEEAIPDYVALTCPMCRREIPRREEANQLPMPMPMPVAQEPELPEWRPLPRVVENRPPVMLYQPGMKTGKRIFPQKNKSSIILG